MTATRSKLGALRQRPNGRWTSQIRNPLTKRMESMTWPVGTSKTDANRRHHAWCLGVLDRTQATSRDPLSSYLQRWLTVIEPTISPASMIVYRRAVNRITRIAGTTKIKDVDPQLVDHILSELRAHGYAHSTITNTRAVLVAALDRAVQWNLLTVNPAKVVKAGRRQPAPAGRDPKVPTTDELDRLIAAEPLLMWRTHWQVLRGTGCRPGEVLAARWGDLDLDAGVFTVWRTITRGTDGRQTVGSETKNRKDRRVTIDPATVRALREWRQDLEQRSPLLVRPDQYVWPSPQKLGEPLQGVTVFYAWKAALKRVKVTDARTLHGIRHWHASTLMAAGVHPQDVANRLGHSIAQTMLRYGIHLPVGERRVEAALGERSFDRHS